MAATATFLPVTEKNVAVFRVINEQGLPVRYADKFYNDLIKTPVEFTKFGAVACCGAAAVRRR